MQGCVLSIKGLMILQRSSNFAFRQSDFIYILEFKFLFQGLGVIIGVCF